MLTITSLGFSQETLTLFTDVNENILDNSQIGYLKAIKNRDAMATYKTVMIPNAKDLYNADKINMNLKPGLTVQAIKKSIDKKYVDEFVWLGKIEDRFSQVTLAVNSDEIYGTIWLDGELYRIESLGGDKHAIVEVDLSKFNKKHQDIKSGSLNIQEGFSTNGATQSLGKVSKSQSTVEIDVMVVYTPAVSAAVSNISGLITTAESETNTALDQSEADARINVVYKTEVD